MASALVIIIIIIFVSQRRLRSIFKLDTNFNFPPQVHKRNKQSHWWTKASNLRSRV